MKRFGAVVVLVFAPIGSCTDPTWPAGDVGVVTFGYEGAESGRFTAVGVRPDDWASKPHAAGQRLESPAHTWIVGHTRDHSLWLAGDVSASGRYSLVEEGAPGAAVFQGELALDVDHSRNTARLIFVLTAGELTLESTATGRIRGRFAGTARELNGTRTITLARGHFDVPDNLPRPVN